MTDEDNTEHERNVDEDDLYTFLNLPRDVSLFVICDFASEGCAR